MHKMRVVAVVPSIHTGDVAKSLAFEGVDYSVFADNAAATAHVQDRRTPDLIIGNGSLLTWVMGNDSLKGVPFVALDETGILSEDVAIHAGARELISLYETPSDRAAEWWADTLHRLVEQYKPVQPRVEHHSLARMQTPKERATAVADQAYPEQNNAYHVHARTAIITALTAAFTAIDELRDRVDQLECRFNNSERA